MSRRKKKKRGCGLPFWILAAFALAAAIYSRDSIAELLSLQDNEAREVSAGQVPAGKAAGEEMPSAEGTEKYYYQQLDQVMRKLGQISSVMKVTRPAG